MDEKEVALLVVRVVITSLLTGTFTLGVAVYVTEWWIKILKCLMQPPMERRGLRSVMKGWLISRPIHHLGNILTLIGWVKLVSILANQVAPVLGQPAFVLFRFAMITGLSLMMAVTFITAWVTPVLSAAEEDLKHKLWGLAARGGGLITILLVLTILVSGYFATTPVVAAGPTNGETWVILTTYGRVETNQRPLMAYMGIKLADGTIIRWEYLDIVLGPQCTPGHIACDSILRKVARGQSFRFNVRVSEYVTLKTDYAPIDIGRGRMTAFYRVYEEVGRPDIASGAYTEIWVSASRLHLGR